MTTPWRILPRKSYSASPAPNLWLRCHSIFRRRRFSGASGLICNRLHLEKHGHTPKLPKPFVILRRSERLLGHARLIPWLSLFRATACCALTASLEDIDG